MKGWVEPVFDMYEDRNTDKLKGQNKEVKKKKKIYAHFWKVDFHIMNVTISVFLLYQLHEMIGHPSEECQHQILVKWIVL